MGHWWTKDEIALLERYFKEGVSDRTIAERLGRTTDAVMIKRGKLRLIDPKSRRLDADVRQRMGKGQKTGCDSRMWKGGRRVNSAGYVDIFDPDHHRARGNGYVSEHIVEAEKKLGRRMLPHERVHHIDHNKQNNSQDNLDVVTQSQHVRIHAKEDRPKRLYPKACEVRGTDFYVMKCLLPVRKFCGLSCATKAANKKRWDKYRAEQKEK